MGGDEFETYLEAEGAEGAKGAEEVDQGEVSTIILGMLESSGFRKYSTLLVIRLFSRCLSLCHWLCICLCLCICVPNSFLNRYYHKFISFQKMYGFGGVGQVEVRFGQMSPWWDERTTNRTTKQGKIGLLSQWTMEG